MWNALIMQPLAFIINMIYQLVQNYGLAIVIFTIVIKAILLPLNVKGMRASMEMQKLQPKIKEIQEKYKDDKQRALQEQQKLYERENVKPTAGCLPQLLPMIIMIALYYVVAQPLTYILDMDAAAIEGVYNRLIEIVPDMQALSFYKFRQVDLMNLAIQNGVDIPLLNLNFLGLNMAYSPASQIGVNALSVYWLLPIFSTLTAWYSQKLMMAGIKKAQDSDVPNPMQSTMKFMPFFSGWITFQFSSALGVYWIISNITQILQQWYINKNVRNDSGAPKGKLQDANKKPEEAKKKKEG